MTDKSLGDLFKRLREEAGLSQEKLALNGGLSQSVISRIERGEIQQPTDETFMAYSKALDRPVEQLRALAVPFFRDARLSLGFLHGIGASPIILMVMEGELNGIRSASTIEDGEFVWIESGAGAHTPAQATHTSKGVLSAKTLREHALGNELDMIVASADMFRLELTRNWKRCALISTSYQPLHLLTFERSSGESPVKRSSRLALEDYTADNPAQIFYPDGTVGQRYLERLSGSEFRKKIKPVPFEVEQLDEDHLPELLCRAFENESVKCFSVIAWHPIIAYIEAHSYLGWCESHTENITDVLNRYKLPYPDYSVDLLLNIKSPALIKFIRRKGYLDLFAKLEQHSRELSPDNLHPYSSQVVEISEYLKMSDPENCYEELRQSSFKFLIYPDFFDYLQEIG